jgi:hypothetical protein
MPASLARQILSLQRLPFPRAGACSPTNTARLHFPSAHDLVTVKPQLLISSCNLPTDVLAVDLWRYALAGPACWGASRGAGPVARNDQDYRIVARLIAGFGTRWDIIMGAWKLLRGWGSLECRTLDPREDDDLPPTKPAGGCGPLQVLRRWLHPGPVPRSHQRVAAAKLYGDARI